MKTTYKIEDTGSTIEVRKYINKKDYIVVYSCCSHEEARQEIARIKGEI